jgi:hypothetical protein
MFLYPVIKTIDKFLLASLEVLAPADTGTAPYLRRQYGMCISENKFCDIFSIYAHLVQLYFHYVKFRYR